MEYCIPFNRITLASQPAVGGKNASLGEMIRHLAPKDIHIPDGFAVTVDAYWKLVESNGIADTMAILLSDLDRQDYSNLREISRNICRLVLDATMPEDVRDAVVEAYRKLATELGRTPELAVRSSATAEDLPTASFAGQQASYLNIVGEEELLEACHNCYASLFTERAIKYREDQGFDHMKVALSIGIQLMVRADRACSGVAFTIDPETGFDKVIVISGAWGLGENVVQGSVNPDEFILYKPNVETGRRAVLSKRLGSKEKKMIYAAGTGTEAAGGTLNVETTEEEQAGFVLSDEEIAKLGTWCLLIEEHYGRPMDIEWAKDGLSGEMYIVQARPETVHSVRDPRIVHTYELTEQGKLLTEGIAIGSKIASGKVRILGSPAEADKLQKGEVLVTDITNPDWDPIMKKAAAIITNKGGRTSHSAIVAREMGIVAVVGTGNATEVITDGEQVTVSCAEGKRGKVYDGELPWNEHAIDTRNVDLPETAVMFILGDPEKAFQTSFLPNNGVGLTRLEFIINNSIRVHPMALVRFDELENEEDRKLIEKLTANHSDKESYFVDLLSQAVGTIAAAFYPKDVIVRMSDFKTNEYANLIGGRQFEPHEENPMLGFRGASRYYSDLYREGFRLECEAMKVVRNEMGFTNVKLMIPFCRTVAEGRRVVGLMAEYGLARGVDGLEIYMMVEIPSNVILAEQFAEIFDGFSIGSNDLTQLTLGLDRDSRYISYLFSEHDEAVRTLISQVIAVARRTGTGIGLCGQAPSDSPEFAQFLVGEGIDSISFNPDSLLQGIENIHAAELKKREAAATVHQQHIS